MKWVMLARKHPELLSKIEELCQTNPDIINEKNSGGWTSLMMASQNANSDSTEMVVQILLQYGADPNLQNNGGWTALMKAVRCSRTGSTEATVALLLQYKADPNFQENDGWTALMMAARYSRTESTEYTVELLLQHDADPNLQQARGWTALMMAARDSRTDSTVNTIQILLTHNAKYNLQNANGESALSLTIYEKDEETMNLLLQSGANVNYNILTQCLTNGLSHSLIEKIISMIDNISETEFRQLSKFPTYLDMFKKIAPRISFSRSTDKDVMDEIIYYEKFRRAEWQNKYSQTLINMDIMRNRLFYKDTSFGGWITIKKLNMNVNNQTLQSLFDTLLVSNNEIDQKYMDLFCIYDITRLEELFAYY